MTDDVQNEPVVIVHTPYGQDAKLVTDCLVSARPDMALLTAADCDSLADAIDRNPNCVVVCTQEGLTRRFVELLHNITSGKPPWAQFPLVLVLDATIQEKHLRQELGDLWGRCLISILHRPLAPLEFRSAVENAIAARLRQSEMAAHVAYQEELKNELHHRIKNTMATVMALFRMSMRESSDLKDFESRFSGRIGAMNAVNDLLRQSDDSARTLDVLARTVLEPYEKPEHRRVAFEGERAVVSREGGLTIALILNELTTNAVKHGALSNDDGHISIKVDALDAEAIRLIWREIDGPPVTPPIRKSYGTRFIESGAMGLGGSADIHYEPAGLRCEVTMQRSRL